MKNIIKIISIFVFLIISIYTTNYSVESLKNKDPIMQEIKRSTSKYQIEPKDATIIDNSIIPGIYGKKIDYNESYNRMKKYGMYNESLTKVIDVAPTISINENNDKYIEKGNNHNRNISIVITIKNKDYINNVLSLVKQTKEDITFFIDGTLLESNLNIIRNLNKYEIEILSYDGKIDEVFFKTSISYLNQITKNKVKYCLTEEENVYLLNMCKKEKLHTIKQKSIKNDVYQTIKKNLEKGRIYVVDSSNMTDILNIIKFIKSKGYDIVRLECLLSEKIC